MADIAKCSGNLPFTTCPLKDKCYRFTAPTGYMQSWFLQAPYDEEKKGCDHFYPLEKKGPKK